MLFNRETVNKDNILPIHVGQTERLGGDYFVKIEHLEQGRYFHKVYIRVKEGKVYTNKIIKILNENIFEFGGEVFIKGRSLREDLVNGNEII